MASNEDEYVELAVQLASDINALASLRMRLRNIMLKSPLCDGSKFTRGLESSYRSMWQRYCNGDVPSLVRMEQQQLDSQEAFSEEPRKDVSRLGPIMANGFKLEQCSSPSITNGEWDHNGDSRTLS